MAPGTCLCGDESVRSTAFTRVGTVLPSASYTIALTAAAVGLRPAGIGGTLSALRGTMVCRSDERGSGEWEKVLM